MRSLIALLIAGLPALATPITNANITGLGTTNVNASAMAMYVGGGNCSQCPADPFQISANASAMFTTFGPARAGFIEIFGSGLGEFGSGNGSVGGYSFGCGQSCLPANYLNGTPMSFTLGVPFQVNVSAFAGHPELGGNGQINFHFLLFESVSVFEGFDPMPGPSVAVFDAAAVPEPATFVPAAVGLLWLAWARRRSSGLRVH
jgi:hypothetical protein